MAPIHPIPGSIHAAPAAAGQPAPAGHPQSSCSFFLTPGPSCSRPRFDRIGAEMAIERGDSYRAYGPIIIHRAVRSLVAWTFPVIPSQIVTLAREPGDAARCD